MRFPTLAIILLTSSAPAADFRGFLEMHCLDCHDGDAKKGGLDLSRFTDEAAVMGDREVWRAVYEKIESHQMPPPKQKEQPTPAQRQELMTWIMDIAARPDPALGAVDPGKPSLRRLTRLEYNNAVRDLFGLDVDVFMFSERLPLSDKSYFQPASGKMPDTVKVPLREYGQKYPVLCRQLGLPGDNRAEHGYRNRGDAMGFSPLLLEKYLAAATEIVNAPELVTRSEIAAHLFGMKFEKQSVANASPKGALNFMAARTLARDAQQWKKAEGIADNAPQAFFTDVQEAFDDGIGGVFDSGDGAGKVATVPAKGGLLRTSFAGGAKALTINPNADLWLAGFATVKATSGSRIFTNQTKGEKSFELTFRIENGDEDEAVTRLGVFVLSRKSQSGQVTLTAKFTDDTDSSVSAMIAEGPAGTTFFSFAAVPGEGVKSLLVDGSRFSGDYLVLDDLGFITSGKVKSSLGFSPKKPLHNQPIGLKPKLLSPRERLTSFMERAFRRPVSEDEAGRFIALFEAEQKRGKTEAEAMKATVAAVLASPAFLYIEANGMLGDAKVSPLEDHELATRLAAFLWSSIPDEELLALARSGRLRDPAVLESQTRRMLKDPRSRELSESFAVQWLRLDQLSTAKPDPDLFKSFYSGPQGKSTLHGAMLTEALLLFETVQVEDRSILDFIAADYTWLNAGLARLYGIPLSNESRVIPASTGGDPTREVKNKSDGGQWHRVRLTDANRGGFAGMAAPMLITSLPFRTSPVKRGAWMLETLFNRPPTEPKVAFAIENDTKEAAQQMSVRQRFEAHRNKAACYSCHIRLDPPGFALERFDPIGQWNDKADAASEWSGQPFDGPAGFKALITAKPHEFTRGFIEHLLGYALGRELHLHDMPVVEKIEQAAKADGWRFSRVIVEIAKSYPFTHVRQTLLSVEDK
jgi:hypothetical protein